MDRPLEVIDSETYDFKQNQQKAKLSYLKREISQLNEQIKDISELIDVNKRAINIARQNLSSPSPINSSSLLNNEKGSSSKENNEMQNTISLIMNCLYEENFKLKEAIKRLTEERNQGQNRVRKFFFLFT
jgi:multidrug resistance efflux pump